MKSKTYKITLVIEAAIAVLIAFCLAFFGPLSLNDMTYGEFDMQVFELCFTYPANIIFIALFVVLAVISYKKEHTKKRYATEIVLFAVLLIFVYFLGVFVPRTFRYEGVVMNAAEYTDIMHELKPSKCFEGENTDYIEKIGENIARDKRNDLLLFEMGWKPIHFWEKEVIKSMQFCADSIIDAIKCEGEKTNDDPK